MAIVRKYISQGKTCKIFTARVSEPCDADVRPRIERWCIQHIGQKLEITNIKDHGCREIYDDIAKQVIPNKGILVEDQLEMALRILKAKA